MPLHLADTSYGHTLFFDEVTGHLGLTALLLPPCQRGCESEGLEVSLDNLDLNAIGKMPSSFGRIVL